MADLTFFWHDYETFGIDPRRDRPAQFAGIRTDAELNEIGEPLMCYCQPAPDYLPDPQSCLITGITPQLCQERGLPENEFAAAIEKELAAPGTIGVGYNTIRFDDEFTRHLFWRNLIDPYAREWQNDCGRWDLLDVVRCAYALRPEGIVWPTNDDGKPSFRLEHLTAANGLVHEAAHDALSDVRATIALARLIRQNNPKLFDFCLKLRKKDAVQAEIGLPQRKPFLHISGMFAPERGCLAVVWPLACHPTNKNEIIVWDLAHDPAELFALDAATVRQRLFTRSDELPEGMTRLPVKSIHINKSPIVIGNLKTLSPQMAEKWGVDMATVERHAATAAQAPEQGGLWAEVFQRPAGNDGTPDVDGDLYGGFIGNNDRRTLNRLRGLNPEQLAAARPSFDDARLDELLFRFRARNFPLTLSEEEAARWQQHCTERLHEGKNSARDLASYFENIDALSETADERGEEILGALYDYAENIAPELN
ncbi:Exodeoxyribonuclease I subunit C [Formivibrio citricus]|uniref:Exodeoxyribonuclease I n=1 Tax=Formivibrio citricus TaxID=83765 RepID=A0A1I5AHF1_9NEIS|nr:exodeoxyribonuclease I [Formivibrio citricus]SFN61865.1 Exodeoxyribonuclease I subunit C [Formivibrio citricus]